MSKKTYNRIKELLAKEGKKGFELAEHLQVDKQTVSNWSTNQSQPDFAMLFAIADYLQVEARELINLKKDLKAVKKRAETAKKKGGKKG